MNLFKGLFAKKNETVKTFKGGFKIKESASSKMYNDVSDVEATVAELLAKFEKQNSIIVMETFSKQEKKVIGRRRLLPFEVPYRLWKTYSIENEIKIKFYFADKEELNIPSSKMVNMKRGKPKQQSLFNVDELIIEREGVVKFHHDYNKNLKEVKLFITKDIVLFHPVKEKLRVTQIPLVYIDAVTKHDNEPNTFVISTTGVDYFFCCKNEEAVNIWIKDLIYFIRYAQEKFLVQQAEIKMNESNVNVINSLLSLCDLSENEIFAKKKLRDSLFRMLEKKIKDDSGILLNSKKRYIEAFEKDDRINMEEILSMLTKENLITKEEDSELEIKRRNSEMTTIAKIDRSIDEIEPSTITVIRPSGFFNLGDLNSGLTIKSQIYYKRYYDKFREELRELFEIDEFVAFLLDEIYNGTAYRCNGNSI
jgi:hypothetical protein